MPTGDEASRGLGGFHNAEDLVAVDVPEFHAFGRFILPAARAVGTFQKRLLILGLRHPPRRAPHALIGSAFIGEGPNVPPAFDRRNDNFAACFELDAVDGDVGGRLEAVGGLSDIAECLVGDLLSLGLIIRPDAEEHHAAGTVEEGAERLHAFLQLSRRALELQSRAFPFFDEGGKLFRVGGNPHGRHGRFSPYGGESSRTWLQVSDIAIPPTSSLPDRNEDPA